ncbi:MAG: hydrolase [Acidiferrobacterales bacterium]
MPSSDPFKPAWWCPGPHMQTLWSTLFRRGLDIELTEERLELPDGDFVDLHWTANRSGPIVVVLHGLEGCSRSPYVQGLLSVLQRAGLRGVVMHFRGCSGTPNRLPRSYHSGDTDDFAHLIATLERREPHTPLAAVGYSLGGNVLLKWLGETGAQTPLRAAVAVSVPFLLAHAAARVNTGFSRVYQRKLLRSMRRRIRYKLHRMPLNIKTTHLRALRSFRAFDDCVTAPLHGFRSADHYYGVASCHQYLHAITIDTLIVHPRADPCRTQATIPTADDLSARVQLELYAGGGHVGFIGGRWPWQVRYWLEERIAAYLQPRLQRTPDARPSVL